MHDGKYTYVLPLANRVSPRSTTQEAFVSKCLVATAIGTMRLPQWAAMRPIGVCRLALSFLSSQHVAERGDITRLHLRLSPQAWWNSWAGTSAACICASWVRRMTTITLYNSADEQALSARADQVSEGSYGFSLRTEISAEAAPRNDPISGSVCLNPPSIQERCSCGYSFEFRGPFTRDFRPVDLNHSSVRFRLAGGRGLFPGASGRSIQRVSLLPCSLTCRLALGTAHGFPRSLVALSEFVGL